MIRMYVMTLQTEHCYLRELFKKRNYCLIKIIGLASPFATDFALHKHVQHFLTLYLAVKFRFSCTCMKKFVPIFYECKYQKYTFFYK